MLVMASNSFGLSMLYTFLPHPIRHA